MIHESKMGSVDTESKGGAMILHTSQQNIRRQIRHCKWRINLQNLGDYRSQENSEEFHKKRKQVRKARGKVSSTVSVVAAVIPSPLDVGGNFLATREPIPPPPMVPNAVSDIVPADSVTGKFWLIGQLRLRFSITPEVGETQS